MTIENEMRFEFGKNWHRFIRRNFSQHRCDIAKEHILKFMGRDSLHGLDFLDIGCGSGLHSLAAFQSGAGRIHSFDYDPHSVAATKLVRSTAGDVSNWTVERGDILDESYVTTLGQWNFVYSWGVLHHTGNVWQAVRNAQSRVAEGGLFYIALYSADVDSPSGQQFWLDAKQNYNRSTWFGRKRWEGWYIWHYYLNRRFTNLPRFIRQAAEHRLRRGMNIFADLRDWLGGWPMEYAYDQEVVDLLEQECGFTLKNLTTGEACSEFLFERTSKPNKRSIVADIIAARAGTSSQTTPVFSGPSETRVLTGPFVHNSGHMYSLMVPQLADLGDTQISPRSSPVRLQEDGKMIGEAHATHAHISTIGQGRFSHWESAFYFSASDNSDPNSNGRTYSLVYPAVKETLP